MTLKTEHERAGAIRVGGNAAREKQAGSRLNSENLREHGHLTFRFADVEALH
jgi:sorbitol-specific phosphotransferase system component IIA